jgi:hypothetical protein
LHVLVGHPSRDEIFSRDTTRSLTTKDLKSCPAIAQLALRTRPDIHNMPRLPKTMILLPLSHSQDSATTYLSILCPPLNLVP